VTDKIIINGRALAGKDVIADYLVQKYGFTKITFAEPIYWICKNLLFMRKKDRRLLQFVGQLGRKIHKNIWVKIAFWNANRIIKKGGKVVFSDCRQENEYLHAIVNDFMPIRVSASHGIRIIRALERDEDYPDVLLWENRSETGADHFVYTEIENNGTLEELHRKIDELLNEKGR
jgi:dephospho-CoA kinase